MRQRHRKEDGSGHIKGWSDGVLEYCQHTKLSSYSTRRRLTGVLGNEEKQKPWVPEIKSLEYKKESGDWVDNLMTKESNAIYTTN
jgi:hypothetical protein